MNLNIHLGFVTRIIIRKTFFRIQQLGKHEVKEKMLKLGYTCVHPKFRVEVNCLHKKILWGPDYKITHMDARYGHLTLYLVIIFMI